MTINLHIDRLILDGIDLPPGQRPRLQAAVADELGRLLTAEGISPGLVANRAVPQVPAGTMQLNAQANPTQMGQQIARAVYQGLKP